MHKRWGILWGLVLAFAHTLIAQKVKDQLPPIQLVRAEESYLFLRDVVEKDQVFLQPLKLIGVIKPKGIFLTIGGEYRARFESFTNEGYSTENDAYYSQRLDIHGSLQLGSRLRLFGEVYHGYTSGEERILEDDHIDLHQGFVEVILIDKEVSNMSLRLGRQEIGYGASRLIGIREGPNMRRSFDMGKFAYQMGNGSLNVIYGKELTYSIEAFDNRSNFFDNGAMNPTIWGIYLQDNAIGKPGHLDFYYFGFNSNTARFNDVIGEETRHSIGVRSHGTRGRFSFNTEFIYQFGELGTSDISAYNFETDWKYVLVESGWKPTLGLRLDFSSGDANQGDGKIQTFNPMFVNPAIYSLAAVNTPSNLTGFHPNLTIFPANGLSIYMDYALFYRTRSNDGLYTPPRFVLRESNGISEKHIGDVIGLQVNWEINRNISFDLRSSYFMAGKFIEASGNSENTFYIAPTVSLKF